MSTGRGPRAGRIAASLRLCFGVTAFCVALVVSQPMAALAASAQPPADHRALATALSDTLRGTVVLLHGLGRTPGSMKALEIALESEGYRAINLPYPSLEAPPGALVDSIASALRRCCQDTSGVHFVTHSLGGILVRAYAARGAEVPVGRVVMLSPPNHGSEVIDHLPEEVVLEVLGPTGATLGTEPTSLPRSLPAPSFELGIITGDASINPLFSWWLPGPDDGKVSTASAKLAGAEDFLVVPYTHAFIMEREPVIRQVLAFLRTGSFNVRSVRSERPRPDEGH